MFKDIRQVVKDSILYGMGNIAVKLVGFVLIPLYTDEKYFSPADYGLMGLLEVTSQILIAVMGLSLFSGLIRWYWDDELQGQAKVYFFHDLVVYLCNFHFRGRIALVQRGRAFRVNLVRRGIHDGKSGALHFAVAYSLFYIGRFNRVTPKFVTIEEQTSFYSLSNITRLLVTLVLTVYFTVSLERGIWGILRGPLIGVACN